MASVVYFALAALFVCVAHANSLPSFNSFMEMHSRTYKEGSAEYDSRKALYEQRRVAAELHNNRSDRLWTAGVNKLWDWTEAEFQSLRGWDGSARPASSSARAVRRHFAFLQHRDSDLPKEKVWSDLAMAKHVKNQGDCGSCWAIATATVLEGHSEIYMGKVRTFSVQQIVECTPNPRHCGGDGGCRGATAELAMDWVLKNGCAEESEVPYTAADSACGMDGAGSMAQVMNIGNGAARLGMTGFETLPKNQYEPLARALAFRGPVAVSVSAGSWLDYESGIFDGCNKDAVIDHAVVALGYGEDKSGKKFWEIQNSWGNDWGENGHIRLQRHAEEEYCGMNNDPQKGVACQGETKPVPVCGMCGVLFDSVVPHFG